MDTDLLLTQSDFLITGDFNLHMDDKSKTEVRRFSDLLSLSDFKQHVKTKTHSGGHLLDLLITRAGDKMIDNIFVNNCDVSDHSAVHFRLQMDKPSKTTQVVTSRKLKGIDMAELKTDFCNAFTVTTEATSVSNLTTLYNSQIIRILDKHAPSKTRTIIIRPDSRWFNDHIMHAKRLRRRYERRYRHTKRIEDDLMFKAQSIIVNNLIDEAKSDYYCDKISKCNGDQKQLFSLVSELLHSNGRTPLPLSDSSLSLANRFSDFFVRKIDKIHDGLVNNMPNATPGVHETEFIGSPLSSFQPATEEEIKKIIMKSPSRTCSLDPLPTHLLKECVDELISPITKIVNMSLAGSEVPNTLKEAIVTPLLKKKGLPIDILNNYRPVSNLSFISKIIERIFAVRLHSHMSSNALGEVYQSAYKQYHSVETALLKVQNDLLLSLDQNQSVILVLLDLSAAFDTIDHNILLNRLRESIGITGEALKWFESYLSERTQSVNIDGTHSRQSKLSRGVPQGSVLGPILFTIYTMALGHLIREHGLDYHMYADDTQIYISFNNEDVLNKKSSLERCIQQIKCWMSTNFLKLNDDKTEILVMSSKFSNVLQRVDSVEIGQYTVSPQIMVRNLGAIMDSKITLESHINNIVKLGYQHLHRIGHIRKYLNRSALETLVHAFISSRIDGLSGLLCGLPRNLLSKLQRLQNAAARIVTGCRRRDHITPVLYDLHWLPVEQRIIFKICLLVYKCLHGVGPEYLASLLHGYRPARSLRSMHKNLLVVPQARTRFYGERAFSIYGPKTWNALPIGLKDSPSLTTFKRNLKTHLFNIAFGMKI